MFDPSPGLQHNGGNPDLGLIRVPPPIKVHIEEGDDRASFDYRQRFSLAQFDDSGDAAILNTPVFALQVAGKDFRLVAVAPDCCTQIRGGIASPVLKIEHVDDVPLVCPGADIALRHHVCVFYSVFFYSHERNPLASQGIRSEPLCC